MSNNKPAPGELTALHKQYADLYGRGLVGLQSECIQVDGEYFKEMFSGNNITAEWNGSELEVQIIHNGVKFIALL